MMCNVSVSGDISKPSRPVSAATLSSNEDLEERDGAVAPFEQSEWPITENIWEAADLKESFSQN